MPDVKIILSANPEVIAHSTVRIFASLHTKVLSGLVDISAAAGKVDKKAQLANEKFKRILRLLPYALIEDSKMNRSINIAHIKRLLSEGTTEEISNLQDEIYAEVFDSRYCSDESRQILKEKFQTTGLILTGDPDAMQRVEAKQKASRDMLSLTDDLTPISETVYRDDQYHYRTTVTEEDQVDLRNPRVGKSGTRTYSYLSDDEYYSKTTPVFAGGIEGFTYVDSEHASTVSNLIYGPMYEVNNAASWAGNALYGMWYGQ